MELDLLNRGVRFVLGRQDKAFVKQRCNVAPTAVTPQQREMHHLRAYLPYRLSLNLMLLCRWLPGGAHDVVDGGSPELSDDPCLKLCNALIV